MTPEQKARAYAVATLQGYNPDGSIVVGGWTPFHEDMVRDYLAGYQQCVNDHTQIPLSGERQLREHFAHSSAAEVVDEMVALLNYVAPKLRRLEMAARSARGQLSGLNIQSARETLALIQEALGE